MTHNRREHSTIIQTQPKQLAVRHTGLIERGVHSFPIIGMTETGVEELCLALLDWDFDIRAKALESIANIGPHVRSCRRYVDSLVFPVVENMYEHFGPELTMGYQIQGYLFAFGKHYPPDGKYLELLRKALQSLVGVVKSPDKAVMDVLYYGTSASKVRAVEWLANHRLTANTHELFSEYLRITLLPTVRTAPLSLALRYANAKINKHIDESIYFFIDEIILEKAAVEHKKKAREYLLCLQDEVSKTPLLYAFSELAKSEVLEDRECATELFFDAIIENLDDFSDDDLKMIHRIGYWPSDEEDEEIIMSELRRRGLRR